MLKTFTEQAAAALREELERGRWTQTMPGRDQLAREMGVNGRTVDRALAQLEREGLLRSQGPGRPRRIVAEKRGTPSGLQVKMILYEGDDVLNHHTLEIRRALESSGHRFSLAPKSLRELKQDPRRVKKMVEADPAKAWILTSGARPVLEWLAATSIPAFALFGRMARLPIAGAGPDSLPALKEALHRLIDSGHRRIVMLTRHERRNPKPGLFEEVFLAELKRAGLFSGAYNLPDWEETSGGLRRCLDDLFAVTPPTALFLGDAMLSLAVKNYFAQERGPQLREVALVSCDYHPSFKWCVPPVAHFQFDSRAIVRYVARWADHVARGKADRRQKLVVAKLIGADTIEAVVAEDSR